MADELIFTHPSPKLPRRKLVVSIKPDEITWSYGLNTANYPTYGGEVVQILSAYIEDVTIAGTTRSYRQLERIYKYFIGYIQIATQGQRGTGSFDPRPIKMHYPHRGWQFDIHPKQLVSFRYGRDITAPEWRIVAAVADPDQDLEAKIMDKAALDSARSNGDVKLFGQVKGNIGYESVDPFRSPILTKKKAGDELRNAYGNLGDYFNNLIPAYLDGDFDDLSADYSRPAIGEIGDQSPQTLHGASNRATRRINAGR